MARAKSTGSGWHFQSERHSRARRTGHAGGKYKELLHHPNTLGAGAATRLASKLPPREKFKAVMAEYEKGTLHDSHGNIVTDKSQAIAIAYSESDKHAMKYAKTHPSLKDETFTQLKHAGIPLSNNGDADKDGVKNKDDCRPLDPKKQGWLHELKEWNEKRKEKKEAEMKQSNAEREREIERLETENEAMRKQKKLLETQNENERLRRENLTKLRRENFELKHPHLVSGYKKAKKVIKNELKEDFPEFSKKKTTNRKGRKGKGGSFADALGIKPITIG